MVRKKTLSISLGAIGYFKPNSTRLNDGTFLWAIGWPRINKKGEEKEDCYYGFFLIDELVYENHAVGLLTDDDLSVLLLFHL